MLEICTRVIFKLKIVAALHLDSRTLVRRSLKVFVVVILHISSCFVAVVVIGITGASGFVVGGVVFFIVFGVKTIIVGVVVRVVVVSNVISVVWDVCAFVTQSSQVIVIATVADSSAASVVSIIEIVFVNFIHSIVRII